MNKRNVIMASFRRKIVETEKPEIPGSWLPFKSCGPEQMHNPRGTQFLDSAALLPEQQQRLNERKAEGRKQNENYLAAHPEVQLSINLFVQEVLEQRPKNIMKQAVNFFTNPELEEIIDDLLRKRKEQDALLRRAAKMGPQQKRQGGFGGWKSLHYKDSRDELGINKDGFYGIADDDDGDVDKDKDKDDIKDTGKKKNRRRRKRGGEDGGGSGGSDGGEDSDQSTSLSEYLDPFRDCLPSCRENCRIAGGHIPISRMLSFEAPLQADDSFILDEFKTEEQKEEELKRVQEQKEEVEQERDEATETEVKRSDMAEERKEEEQEMSGGAEDEKKDEAKKSEEMAGEAGRAENDEAAYPDVTATKGNEDGAAGEGGNGEENLETAKVGGEGSLGNGDEEGERSAEDGAE